MLASGSVCIYIGWIDGDRAYLQDYGNPTFGLQRILIHFSGRITSTVRRMIWVSKPWGVVMIYTSKLLLSNSQL